MKLIVKPEGREGIWLVRQANLIDWLYNQQSDNPEKYENIHCFLGGGRGRVLLGADWAFNDVLKKIQVAERIAILTGDAQSSNLRHALSVVANNELYMFDIGAITEADFEQATW